jgi:hypothetical protein
MGKESKGHVSELSKSKNIAEEYNHRYLEYQNGSKLEFDIFFAIS